MPSPGDSGRTGEPSQAVHGPSGVEPGRPGRLSGSTVTAAGHDKTIMAARATAPSLPFVWSSPIDESAQAKLTRVTVSDRQTPSAPAAYGTHMARPTSGAVPSKRKPTRHSRSVDVWDCDFAGTRQSSLGPHLRRTPSFKLCSHSSEPFVGVSDLGASAASAHRRPPRSAGVAAAAAVGRHAWGLSYVGKITLLNVLERQLLSSDLRTCPCYSPPSRTTSSRLLRKMALSGWSVPRVAWVDFSEAKREGGHPLVAALCWLPVAWSIPSGPCSQCPRLRTSSCPGRGRRSFWARRWEGSGRPPSPRAQWSRCAADARARRQDR